MDQAEALRRILVRDLRGFARELALFPDESLLWTAPAGVANAAGNLALHVAGNLQHFIGGVLGGSGYIRDREAEFARRSGPLEELLDLLARAEADVQKVVPTLDPAALAAPYPAAPGGLNVTTGLWLLHLTTHLAFHLGQAGILRRALTGSGAASGAVGLGELVD